MHRSIIRPLLGHLQQQGLLQSAAACSGSPAAAAAGGAICQQQRHAHEVKVVLLKDHPKLGSAGEVVAVKAGRARHSLFPSKEADYAIPGVLKRLRERGLLKDEAAGQLQQRQEQQQLEGGGKAEQPGRPEAIEMAIAVLASSKLTTKRRFRRRTEEEGMVGSVRAADIRRLAEEQLNIVLPRSQIMLDEPITEFGEFKVPLNFCTKDGRQVELRLEILKTRRM